MTKTFPRYLNRLVDFCCDHSGNGCGHHIDGHGYGNECHVPGCTCRTWRDHTYCDHRTADANEPGYTAGKLTERRRITIALESLRANRMEADHRPGSKERHRQDGEAHALDMAVWIARDEWEKRR